MSSITNNPFRLARMAGYYKAIQSAGAAVSFGMEAAKVSRETRSYRNFKLAWLIMTVQDPLPSRAPDLVAASVDLHAFLWPRALQDP
jgi:hypothetical protein